MVFTKAAGKSPNEAAPCDTFPGERNMVNNASKKPIRLYDSNVNAGFLFTSFFQFQAYKIDSMIATIIKVVGGSENPPITNAKSTTIRYTQPVGFLSELILDKMNPTNRDRKTNGAK
jgi:hypothetical protein